MGVWQERGNPLVLHPFLHVLSFTGKRGRYRGMETKLEQHEKKRGTVNISSPICARAHFPFSSGLSLSLSLSLSARRE